MASTGAPKGLFPGLRNTRNGIIMAIALSLIASYFILVFQSLFLCLAPALVAIIMYFVPNWFGLKNKKKLAIMGVVLLLVLGVALGVTNYYAEKDMQPSKLADSHFTSGQVLPFRGGAGSYNFSVVLTTGNNTSYIKLRLVDFWAATDNLYNMTFSTDRPEGKLFVSNRNLVGSVYFYSFVYTDPAGATYQSTWGNGPVTVQDGDIFSHNLQIWVVAVFYTVGLLFFMLVLLTWWMDSSKKRYETLQQKKTEKQGGKPEKFVCSECGTEVPGEAKQCPQCGEKFDDEEKKGKGPAPKADDELICSECGKTVKDSDKKCWNCGKEFEN